MTEFMNNWSYQMMAQSSSIRFYSLFGFVTKSQPWLILLELMELGNLADYLRKVCVHVYHCMQVDLTGFVMYCSAERPQHAHKQSRLRNS